MTHDDKQKIDEGEIVPSFNYRKCIDYRSLLGTTPTILQSRSLERESLYSEICNITILWGSL